PSRLQAKDLVPSPEMVRSIFVLERTHFGDDVFRRSDGIALAVDWLRTPVAVIGTAARGDEVHLAVPVPPCPEPAVLLDVYEIPRRQRQCVEVADDLAAGRAKRRSGCSRIPRTRQTVRTRQTEAGDVGQRTGTASEQRIEHL